MWPVFDAFLWFEFVRVCAFVVLSMILSTVEYVSRIVMYVVSFFFPISVLDWIRSQWFRMPEYRLIQDKPDSPELVYDVPELVTSRSYPFEEHYVRTEDGFLLGVHRIPGGKLTGRQRRRSMRGPRLPLHSSSTSAHDGDGGDTTSPLPSDSDVSTEDPAELSLPLPLTAATADASHPHQQQQQPQPQQPDRIGKSSSSSSSTASSSDSGGVRQRASQQRGATGGWRQLSGSRRTTETTTEAEAEAESPAPSGDASAASPVPADDTDGTEDDAERKGSAVPPKPTATRPVVFLMHGLLQSSEAFVVTQHSLAFALADAGFDVWMGNCRGNKYSCTHSKHEPTEDAYWNYCLDEVGQVDIPATLQYILAHTGARSLSYIGFSQGTAVAFACFSTNFELAKKIDLFVALAPATAATGFNNRMLDSLVKTSPDIVYLVLGRHRLLSSTLFWMNLLSTKFLVRVIDFCVKLLFGWDMKNIAEEDKPMMYTHLYSYSSVKCVVHWFQIMRSGCFHRFQQFSQSSFFNTYKGRRAPEYPLRQISCPIAVFYGGLDRLPDTKWLLRQLPASTYVQKVDTYEHMDFLYARNARELVWDNILLLCRKRHILPHPASPLPVPSRSLSAGDASSFGAIE